MRIVSLNVQNMRLRQGVDGARLDGARDGDMPGADSARLDLIDRQLTARLLAEADGDVIALQEVFDRATLDFFHDAFLRPAGVPAYPYRVCRPGNDGRGPNVALLSRRMPDLVQSHAHVTARDLGLGGISEKLAKGPIFRRDLLTVRFGALTLFICHFKAPYPDPRAAWDTRWSEALAARQVIERRFANPARALWLIVGDLNEPAEVQDPGPSALAPLTEGFAVDLMERLPEAERWSYQLPDSAVYAQPDGLLASPALAARFPEAMPQILRAGLGRDAAAYQGARLPGVGQDRPHASDHAALALDLPGL